MRSKELTDKKKASKSLLDDGRREGTDDLPSDLPPIGPRSFCVYTAGEDGVLKQWVFDERVDRRNLSKKKRNPSLDRSSKPLKSDDITVRDFGYDDAMLSNCKGHSAGITHVSVAPPHVDQKDRIILTSSRDMTVKIWRCNGRLLGTLPAHGAIGPYPSVAAAPDDEDGKEMKFRHTDCVNMAQMNGVTKFCDKTGKTEMTFRKLDTVLTCSDDGIAACWDARTGDLETTLARGQTHDQQHGKLGHKGPIPMATWNSDGRRVLTVSYDGSCIMWDVAHGLEAVGRRSFEHGAPVWSGYWSAHDEFVLTAALDAETTQPHRMQSIVRLWNANTGQETACWNARSNVVPRQHEGVIFSAQWNPNKPEQFLTHSVDGSIALWDRRDPKATSWFPRNPRERSAAVWTAEWGTDAIISACHDSTAAVWNLKLGIMQHHLIGHHGPLWQAKFSDSSKEGPHWAVTCSEDNTARVWQLGGGGRHVHSVMLGEVGRTLHKNAVTCAAFMDAS